MELLIATLIGVGAVYRMSTDIVREDLEGPFNLYNIVRNHIMARGYPEWVKDGIWCKFCVSFWFGCAFAIFYPLAGLIGWELVILWAVGLSAPSVWYFNHMDTLFPPSPVEPFDHGGGDGG